MSTVDETNIPKYDWDGLRQKLRANPTHSNKSFTVDMRPSVEDIVKQNTLHPYTAGIYPVLKELKS